MRVNDKIVKTQLMKPLCFQAKSNINAIPVTETRIEAQGCL